MKRQRKEQSIYAVDRDRPDSMTEQLAENIQGAILGGSLKEGDRLPSQKELSVLSGACEMIVREALRRRDWKSFTAAMNDYWTNKKALDPGSTNPMVESILAAGSPVQSGKFYDFKLALE